MEPLDAQVLRQSLQWQAQGQRVLLVTVARTWGSSPRPPGSLMALREDGLTVGSVSGGCVEDDLVHRLRQGDIGLDAATDRPRLVRYGVTTEQAHRFGLPCGGTLELMLEPLSAHSRLAETLAALEQRQTLQRTLDLRSGAVTLAPGGHDAAPHWADEHHFVSQLGPQARLLLIGAGDLSRYLAGMARGMGFDVTVCDPRPEQAQWAEPGIGFSREMPDDLVQRLRPDRRTAVVAVSHDPKLDDLALIDALQTEAFYVGAIGSRRNSATRRQRLREHFGLSEAQLDRLRGPAGLPIGSKTPAEIALSILAEVVATKNGVAAAAVLSSAPSQPSTDAVTHP